MSSVGSSIGIAGIRIRVIEIADRVADLGVIETDDGDVVERDLLGLHLAESIEGETDDRVVGPAAVFLFHQRDLWFWIFPLSTLPMASGRQSRCIRAKRPAFAAAHRINAGTERS